METRNHAVLFPCSRYKFSFNCVGNFSIYVTILTTNFNIILQFSLSAGNQFGVNGFFDQQIFISSKAIVKQIAGG